jgi:hypothetical protein
VEDISLASCSISGKKFDCVISWAVIEHVQDVQKYLSLLKTYCANDGYLMLDTGVTSYLTKLIDTGFTNWLFPPYHLHVFSTNSFKILFKKVNLEILDFYPFWNQENSILMRIYRNTRVIIKALSNIHLVVTKKNPGNIARIGLVVAKNNKYL